MIDVVERQVQLIIVALGIAAILRASIRQNTQNRQLVALIERQYPIIQEVCGRDGRLGGVQLRLGHLAVGVHIGLLINPTNAFERAHVERILRAQVAGMSGIDLAAGFIIVLLLLQRRHLGLGQHQTFLGHPGLQRLQTIPETRQIMPLPDTAYSRRRHKHPAFPQLIADPNLPISRLLQSIGHYFFLNTGINPVLQVRRPAALVQQCVHATFFHCRFVAIKRVTGQTHQLTRLRHVPQLLGQV